MPTLDAVASITPGELQELLEFTVGFQPGEAFTPFGSHPDVHEG